MGKRFWLIVALLASLFMLMTLPRGMMIYFRLGRYDDSPGRIDGFRLWRETHYVMRARNPYDVAFANLPPIARTVNPCNPRLDQRSTAVFADLGWPEGVDYPPWAFISMVPFFWPGVQHYLLYWGVCMLVGMAAAALWAAAEVRAAGESTSTAAVAIALCVLAFNAWGGALSVGNNPAVVVAALVATYVLLRQERFALAGVTLAVALLKPTLAGPFVLPLLIDRRWRTLIVAGSVLLLESILTWSLTRTNPLDMLRQMMVMSKFYIGGGFGPAQYLMHAGVSPPVASQIMGLAGLVLGTVALLLARRRSLLARFAIAAVIARLWSYHYDYDDAVLVFAVVFFAVRAESTRSPVAVAMFLLLCASLWTPGSLAAKSIAAQVLEQGVWIAAAAVVVCNVDSPALELA